MPRSLRQTRQHRWQRSPRRPAGTSTLRCAAPRLPSFAHPEDTPVCPPKAAAAGLEVIGNDTVPGNVEVIPRPTGQAGARPAPASRAPCYRQVPPQREMAILPSERTFWNHPLFVLPANFPVPPVAFHTPLSAPGAMLKSMLCVSPSLSRRAQ